ncbi:hypothetical protein Tco_0232532 [Tanacetum coccineum]
MIKWDPTNPKFKYWLASKFVNYKTMDIFTKGALWDDWKIRSDDTELTNEKGSDLEDECSSDVDETAKIFKIEDNLLDYETPLCKAFNEFNYLLKINTDLFTLEIQEIKTYEEYELNNYMTGELEEPYLDIDGVYGKLKEEALMHKARIEESWRVIKFCEWLKNSFENFHELDYDVLVKQEECWWKVNAHEKSPFAQWENYTNNAGDTQDTKKGHRDPSTCTIRRFEMIKYSFGQDEEYVAVKEDEYEDLTSTSEDACRAYREIFCKMYEGWMDLAAKKSTMLVKYLQSRNLEVLES